MHVAHLHIFNRLLNNRYQIIHRHHRCLPDPTAVDAVAAGAAGGSYSHLPALRITYAQSVHHKLWLSNQIAYGKKLNHFFTFYDH